MYVLEPCSATPLSVHSLVGEQAVVGAVFVPRTLDDKKLSQHPVGERSILHFITKDQVRGGVVSNEVGVVSNVCSIAVV